MTTHELINDLAATAPQQSWLPPGPGAWQRETTHAPGPVTPIFREIISAGASAGTGQMTARYGLPVSHVDFRFVNDHIFMRAIPAIGPKPRKAPPPPVLRVLSRVHPELRRRAAMAKSAVTATLWREDARRWYDEQKPALVAANLALQDEDLTGLDDAGLADHAERAIAHAINAYTLHFALHGADQIPVGDFILACSSWGIDQEEALSTLRGSSPASRGDTAALAPLARAVSAAAAHPATLDDVRALSPSASTALDGYLRLHAWRAVTSVDVGAATEGELPRLVLGAILALAYSAPAADDNDDSTEAVLCRVPTHDRARFTELAEDARLAWGLRDDHVGIDSLWPSGLVRRALLEIGGRLERRGLAEQRDHVFELARDEIVPALGGAGCSAGELSRRAAGRRALAVLDAPYYLGAEPPPPSAASFPPAMARMTAGFLTCMSQWWNPPSRQLLQGTGIGSHPYRGTARVAVSAEDALARVEPGDVLVARFTTPAYNAVLVAVGAVVVEEGGALCHAAIVARELGIPAVVGVLGATTAVRDGQLVEVDPASGTVCAVDAATGGQR